MYSGVSCFFWECRTPSINARCRSMSIIADQNPGIDPKYLSMPIISDQCWSELVRIERNLSTLIGNDRHWLAMGSMPQFWLALIMLIDIDHHWVMIQGVLTIATYHWGWAPTSVSTLSAIRLWRLHFSTAIATRSPPNNRKLMSCQLTFMQFLVLNNSIIIITIQNFQEIVPDFGRLMTWYVRETAAEKNPD